MDRAAVLHSRQHNIRSLNLWAVYTAKVNTPPPLVAMLYNRHYISCTVADVPNSCAMGKFRWML